MAGNAYRGVSSARNTGAFVIDATERHRSAYVAANVCAFGMSRRKWTVVVTSATAGTRTQGLERETGRTPKGHDHA